MSRDNSFRLALTDQEGDNGAGQVADKGGARLDRVALAALGKGEFLSVGIALLGHLDVGARVDGGVLDNFNVVVEFFGHCDGFGRDCAVGVVCLVLFEGVIRSDCVGQHGLSRRKSVNWLRRRLEQIGRVKKGVKECGERQCLN